MSRAGRERPRQPNKKRESPRITAWRRSARCRAVALRALDIARAVLDEMPRCTAQAKSTGQRCKKPALRAGVCRCHGALTPRGDHWHRLRTPARGEKNGIEKFERKLVAKERRDRKTAQRIAAMTSEQRAAHEKWKEAHLPGAKRGRTHRKQQLQTKAMLDKLLADRGERWVEPPRDGIWA